MGAQVRSIHGLSMPQSSSSSTLLVLSIPALNDHCQVSISYIYSIYIYTVSFFLPFSSHNNPYIYLHHNNAKLIRFQNSKWVQSFLLVLGSNDMATWQRSLSSKRGRPWPSTSMFGGQPMPLTSIPAIKMLPPGATGV